MKNQIERRKLSVAPPLARQYHWRIRDLVAETCSALISRAADEAAVEQLADMTDADEASDDERRAA
jgi:hypothetical protein